MPIDRRWYQVKEISAYLGLSIKGTYRVIKRYSGLSAKVPGIGVRIDRTALDKLLESGELTPRRGRPRKATLN